MHSIIHASVYSFIHSLVMFSFLNIDRFSSYPRFQSTSPVKMSRRAKAAKGASKLALKRANASRDPLRPKLLDEPPCDGEDGEDSFRCFHVGGFYWIERWDILVTICASCFMLYKCSYEIKNRPCAFFAFFFIFVIDACIAGRRFWALTSCWTPTASLTSLKSTAIRAWTLIMMRRTSTGECGVHASKTTIERLRCL